MESSSLAGNTAMLLLSILSDKDMYGYEMIHELNTRSNGAFALKAGTLYPLLHSLEEQGCIVSYDGETTFTRVRKYYRLTPQGSAMLKEKKTEWVVYMDSINRVIGEAE